MNVGLNTVVEFLHKNGYPEVESNPNTRLSDEQYALLVKEFGKNMPDAEIKREASHIHNKKSTAAVVKEEQPQEIKTEVPEEFRPKIVMKGHINLEPEKKDEIVPEAVSASASVDKDPEPVVQQEEKVVPAVEKVEQQNEKEEVKINIVNKEKAEEKQPEMVAPKEEKSQPVGSGSSTTSADKNDSELFRLSTPKFESNIKVTGKIDLEALNQSTRPKKKSKILKRIRINSKVEPLKRTWHPMKKVMARRNVNVSRKIVWMLPMWLMVVVITIVKMGIIGMTVSLG